jgi:hypothetical protein
MFWPVDSRAARPNKAFKRQPIESSDKRGDGGFDPLAQSLLFERRTA